MEKIDKIPDSFLRETELTLEQERVLVEQINRFEKLKESYKNIGTLRLDEKGNIGFAAGSLIHGTKKYNENKLDSISKTGILTGQAVGIGEDCETFYCADFHRVKEDISVEEYNLNFKYNDGRCPFGFIKGDNADSVAFVVVPNDMNSELLAYDCYREGTRESEITRSFTWGLPLEDKEVGSSILYGVPANCIEGIVVGGKVLTDKSKIDFLIQKFPHCYIISAYGELIYNPSKGEKLDDEIVDLRREKAVLARDKRLMSRIVDNYERQLNQSKEQYDKLWYQMFYNCKSEDIASVLIGIGWQGNINEEYVDNMKKGYSR